MCKYHSKLHQLRSPEQIAKAARARELRAARKEREMARDAERSAIAARARADAMEELFPGSSAEAAEYAAELAANPRKIRDARDCLVADRWVSPERSGYANAYWRGIDRQREHDDGYAAEPYFSRH